jgi:1-acyl-sn-glycerol-3-phosphate acyltransferase
VKGVLRHPVRFILRLGWLGAEFLFAFLTWSVLALRGRADVMPRAGWLQGHARRVLRVFNVRLDVQGEIIPRGFLVANHLGYLDILVLAAVTPCVFVAKRDVRGWPVFGWFARMAGTIFVDRDRRSDAARTVAEMRNIGRQGVTVVLFPEGTSSDGQTVLPFKSSLLAPLVEGGDCGVAHLRYTLTDGCAAAEVCYWRDMTLVPHLFNLLSKSAVQASLRGARVTTPLRDRKLLASQLHAAVLKLSENQA